MSLYKVTHVPLLKNDAQLKQKVAITQIYKRRKTMPQKKIYIYIYISHLVKP